MTAAAIDGWCDARLGLPPQAALRFIAHEIDADRIDWTTYLAQYLDGYRRGRKEQL